MPASLDIDVKGDTKLRNALERLRILAPKETQEEIIETLEDAKDELAKPAPKPTYPIRWDSEKQRRYVLAKLTQENNLPYSRTGKGAEGWMVTENSRGGGKLANDLPQAVYIWGDENGQGQSRIHKGRWPLFSKVVENIRKPKGLVGRIQRLLNRLIDRLGL